MAQKMKPQKLMKIRLLKHYAHYKPGKVIERRIEHAKNLIKLGHAEPYTEKQEKAAAIETKEEKHAPTESKVMTSADMDAKPEPNDYSDTSTRELGEIIHTLSEDALLNIVKTDYRKTAVKYAEDEIRRRG